MSAERDPAADDPPVLPERPQDAVAADGDPHLRKWIWLTLIAIGVVAVDQWTKQWAFDEVRHRQGGSIELLSGGSISAAFTFVRNPGAAWGLFASAPESFRRPFFFFVSTAAIGFIVLLYLRVHRDQRLLMIALSLVLGGAVGNFVDRVRMHWVIDFVDFRFGSFRWPTFNVADVAISVGVALLFLEMILVPLRQRRARPSASGAPE